MHTFSQAKLPGPFSFPIGVAHQAVDAKTHAITAVATILGQMVPEGRMVTMDSRLNQLRMVQTMGVIAADGVGQVRLHNSPEMAILHSPVLEKLPHKRAHA